MKFWISSLLMIGLLFSACSTSIEPEMEESEEVAQVVLATEEIELQKVTFASEEAQYLYSFEYDKSMFKYLGYSLEGMSENGGAFMLPDGAEIVTSTSHKEAIGIEDHIGNFLVMRSSELEGECLLDYRVVLLDSENLTLRAKVCEDQDADAAAKALNILLHGLTIDAL